MANTTVYPFGTGQMPSGVGVINDLTTGGVDKALSAEQGKKLKGLIGNISINRWSGVADGRYFGTAVGSTVQKQYPSTNANFNVYFTSCQKGDVITFGTKTGYNTQPWLICDSSLEVLAVGDKYNSNTPKALAPLTITQDDAAYLIINSIGETTNILNSGASMQNQINSLSNDLTNEVLSAKEIGVKPLLLYNVCVVSGGNGKIYSSNTIVTYELDVKGLGFTKMRVPRAGSNNYHFSVGFVLSDGTWSTASDGYGLTNTVVTIDVPSNAVRLKGCCNINQLSSGFYATTASGQAKFVKKGQRYIPIKDNSDTLLSIVEQSKTGRFNFQTVGVNDYINAFNELSYTFPDFVKKTKIGDSQTPLSTKSDQNTYPIVRFTYTKSGASPTKKFVFAGGLHGDSEGWTNNGGDSPQNILTLYFFLQDMMMHCEDDPLYKQLTDNYVIEVLPIMNPWGIQNHSRYNGRDVDLNRNFDCNWSSSTDTHKGSEAFSEAESQAIRDFINGLVSGGNYERYIEVHSRGEVLVAASNKFFGVCGSSDKSHYDAAVYAMASKYGGGGGFTAYTSETSYPSLWCWNNFTLNIPGCDIECCQSLNNDISTRHSKLLNLQMTDYVKWCILTQLDIV